MTADASRQAAWRTKMARRVLRRREKVAQEREASLDRWASQLDGAKAAQLLIEKFREFQHTSKAKVSRRPSWGTRRATRGASTS
jgi:hypothetical protein